ncbi:MAG: nicotinate phosphoribosyltransferase [Ilumatobacteraceae bacterium]
MGLALVTDLYELTMAASYLRRGMTAPATFSLFVRKLPPHRGFVVAAGLDDVLTVLEHLAFDESDAAWLREHGFADRDVDALCDLRFTGDVRAMPEGRVLFANEPLLEITAPLPVAQLVETIVLNQITYQTTIASKAARCTIAAAGRASLVDFGLRRTFGIEAGMAATRATAIAGFAGTSNVAAAKAYGLHAVGTMAHAYVEAFPTEREAFTAFAEDFPDRATFLVDTYDTLTGVATAVEVADHLGLHGRTGVRLDSGDLLSLSLAARDLLDRAGRSSVSIYASGGLDELDVQDLLDAGAPIDSFGLGTRIGISADAPSLDSVYKLVEYDGRPVMKLSPGKSTLPGPKQVFRADPDRGDVLALCSEPPPGAATPLLVEVMRDGRRTEPPASLAAAAARLAADLARLPPRTLDLRAPTPIEVHVSEALESLAHEVSAAHRRRPS